LLTNVKPLWKEVFLWDGCCTDQVIAVWPKKLPMPFYRAFSYGGNVNRLLMLAELAGCDFLVHIDPGCYPVGDMSEIILRHIDVITKGTIQAISGQYTERLALRDDFVRIGLRPDYYDLVEKFTPSVLFWSIGRADSITNVIPAHNQDLS
jgi:hypothetical protein